MAFLDCYSEPPFPPQEQLNDEIKIESGSGCHHLSADCKILTIPNQPSIELSHEEVAWFLKRELETPCSGRSFSIPMAGGKAVEHPYRRVAQTGNQV